jgi:non-ribosomal peptide synthetase component F
VTALLDNVQQDLAAMMPSEQVGLRDIGSVSVEAEMACKFQTLLVILPEASPAFQMDTIGKWQPEYMSDPWTYPLLIQCVLRSNGISIKAIYNGNVLDHEVVASFTDGLSHVIQQLANVTPDDKLCGIQVITERHLSTIWNMNAEVQEECQALVHDLLAEQARLHATLPAICAWDGELNYGQLEQLTNNLSRRLCLLGIGIGPEVVVPLCFEKSMWMPVAMLGVMKAGAAGLALDVTQPLPRLRVLARQVRPRLILCSQGTQTLASTLTAASPNDPGNVTILVVEHNSIFEVAAVSVLRGVESSVVHPTNSLCVVFTSGSTGMFSQPPNRN